MRIRHFEQNNEGRDIAVGDIHGHFSHVQKELKRIGFDGRVDRLFGVGDLVDRGPESREAFFWLNKPWFFSVRGNHDDYVARYDTAKHDTWLGRAGKWFDEYEEDEKAMFAEPFRGMPYVIDVETPGGLVGLVHADPLFYCWDQLVGEITNPPNSKRLKQIRESCMHSRRRFDFKEEEEVSGVRAVLVGHNPVNEVLKLGNVYHIDTRGWLPNTGYFTLLDMHTLQPL